MTELAEELIGAPAEGAAAPVPSAPPNIITLPAGQTVTLHPKVSIPLGIAARAVVRNKITSLLRNGRIIGNAEDVEGAIIEGAIGEVYLRLGIESWTFEEEEYDPATKRKSKRPVPINAETIARLLPFGQGGMTVAEAADALYSKEIFPPSPLATKTSKSSPPTSMDGSMSPTNGTGKRLQGHSPRSSRNSSVAGKRSGARAR